jgi:beta-lactamase class A
MTVSCLVAGSYALLDNRGASGPRARTPVLTGPMRRPPMPAPAPFPAAPRAADALPDPAATVRAALAGYLTGRRTHAGIAVHDRVTGVMVGYNDVLRFRTASVVKMDILATLLWQAQRARRQLTASQRHLASEMIIRSDNEAATALWNAIGGASGLAQANRAFGLTQTTPNRAGNWGSTTTTAADQVRLLAVLTNPEGPLSAASRAYELGLLGRVESGQRWGVPRAAGTGATAVYVKNGWLPSTADRGRWIVNSVGRIVEPGHDWLVAVLSDHHPTQGTGIAIVEHLASTALTCSRP